MEILKQVLEGREGRVAEQRRLLEAGDCVVQFALNVPGFPKRMVGDERALKEALKRFFDAFGVEGRTAPALRLDNGAGLAFLVGYRGRDPLEAKRCAVLVETEEAWGRALDMDVLTREGSLGRRDLGLPPRSCLLCGREAKICSRIGAHEVKELRLALADLLAGLS